MNRPTIQAFLKKYAPPKHSGLVPITKEGILRKLARVASANLEKINSSDVLKALELIGKHLGMWEGKSTEGVDRLKELLAVFEAGPVNTKKEPEK
jgi:hypothetical protein